MTSFQRRARFVVAVFAVGFAVALTMAFKRRAPVAERPPLTRTDPTALVESTIGRVVKVNRSREDVSIQYEKQLTYKDGTTRLQGVTIVTTDRGDGRTFTVTGKEGHVGQNESEMVLTGDVHLVASDGLSATTEEATYVENEGIVRAPGPVQFSRKRLSGSGVGMTYDKNADIMVILDQAHLRITPTEGAGPTEVTSATATIARRDKQIRFERGIKALRSRQVIQADDAMAHLTDDEERLESVELRGHSTVTASDGAPGALQALTGRDINLKYGPDGESIEHAVISGDAVLQLAGQKGAVGPKVTANILDISMAPDGSTPVGLVGRDEVQLTFPGEQGAGGRTIKATNLECRGDAKRGLTDAVFTGTGGPACQDRRTAGPECDVDYREQDARGARRAKATSLTVTLKPGMSSIEEAVFSHYVRFQEGALGALAAQARYVLDSAALELTGTEPGTPRPHIENEQIVIDATRIDVKLEGPKMKAGDAVSSVLKPAKPTDATSSTKMPSMLKSDQVVYIAAADLDYDGELSRAIYTGNAKLWQTDTSVQAQTLTLDNRSGDLSGSGAVTTSTMLQQRDKEKAKTERTRSVGTAEEFLYEESIRRATYTGAAHLSGSQGDLTATKIELYLKPSGDEVDRAEAYEKLTMREQERKTTGSRMTYTTADETYVVTGLPVAIVDQCGRETKGRKLTFVKASDTVVVDGGGQVRTQTKNAGKCS